MGVSCTLLGHKYGEAEIEREREERGEEAVVTIREVKTCQRCGKRSVVSENKEVTAAQRDGAEVAKPGDEEAAPTSQPRPTDPDSGDPVAEETIEEAEAAESAEVDASVDADDGNGGDGDDAAAGEASVDAEDGPEHDPETDDGVILDDGEAEEEPEEREYGEWPGAEEDHASAEADPAAADSEEEPAAWPDGEEDADEGYDATTPHGEPADVDFPGSADGEQVDGAVDASESEDADDGGAELLDAEPESAGPADEGADFERAREAGPPSEPGAGDTELYCPACGYRDPSRDGSLREGDICPECRKGYLAAGE